MKYQVKVSLAVVGINLVNGEYNILSADPENLILPFALLDSSSNILNILEQLSSLHIDLDPNWIQYNILDVIVDNSAKENDENILVLYRCIIPLDTKLINASWIPSWKCINNPLIPHILKSI